MAVPMITLNDGVQIPQVGFGVWQVGDDEAVDVVTKALEAGYRHIDTAEAYQNEAGVGKAISQSGVARDELFVTTKLFNHNHKAADARRAIEASLEKLGLDFVDLYLIHWPAVKKYGESYIEAWDAMQEFQAEGLVRSIGVSNFEAHHLDKLNGAVPTINQIELHPSLSQAAYRADLVARGIVPEAWSPLGNQQQDDSDLDHETVHRIAEEVGKEPAQVILRWHLQEGTVIIPKSVTPARIQSNLSLFDFELSDEQMAAMRAVDSNNRQGAHPDEPNW